MPIAPILFGIAAVAVIAGLSSSSRPAPPRARRPNLAPSLGEELDADPIGTIAKYGTASDLEAQGFGDEIAGLGYRD